MVFEGSDSISVLRIHTLMFEDVEEGGEVGRIYSSGLRPWGPDVTYSRSDRCARSSRNKATTQGLDSTLLVEEGYIALDERHVAALQRKTYADNK